MKKFPFRWTPLTIGLAIAIGLVLVLYCCGFRITYAPALESSWSAISAFGQWAGVVVTAALTWIIHRKTQENDRQNKELQEKLARQSEDLQRDLAAQSEKLQRQIAEQENRNVEIQRKVDLFNRRYQVYSEFKNVYYSAKNILSMYDERRSLLPNPAFSFSDSIELYLFGGPSTPEVFLCNVELQAIKVKLNHLAHKQTADPNLWAQETEELLSQQFLLTGKKKAGIVALIQAQRRNIELVTYFYPDFVASSVIAVLLAYHSLLSALWDEQKVANLNAFCSTEVSWLKDCLAKLDDRNILEKMKEEILVAQNL